MDEKLIERLPFSLTGQSVELFGESLPVVSNRIIVFVTPRSGIDAHRRADLRIPALVDTGFNGGFCIHETAFRSWAYQSNRHKTFDDKFPVIDAEHSTNRGEALLRNGSLWLHPNEPGVSDLKAGEPFSLMLPRGIVLLKGHSSTSRNANSIGMPIPLIGMEVISANGLRLVVDGLTRTADLVRTTGCANSQ